LRDQAKDGGMGSACGRHREKRMHVALEEDACSFLVGKLRTRESWKT